MEKKQKKQTKISPKKEKGNLSENTPKRKKGLLTRGRSFKGYVIKKFPKRIAMEFERPIYVRKYERYLKKKTKLHARLPEEMTEEINVGDFIEIHECRPLSKIIHFKVIKKIRGAEGNEK